MGWFERPAGKRRAMLTHTVRGLVSTFHAGTYGYVKFEDGKYWFSDVESFHNQISVYTYEFVYI